MEIRIPTATTRAGSRPTRWGKIPHGRRVPMSVLFAAVVIAAAADAAEPPRRVVHQIPPGQESVLARMFGFGQELPGGCRFAGGTAAHGCITGEYTCGSSGFTIELRHPDDAEPEDLRTAQFAIHRKSGVAPAGLMAALDASVRAHEAEFTWRNQTAGTAPIGWLVGVIVIIVLGIAAQLTMYRLLPRQSRALATSAPVMPSRATIAVLIAVYVVTRVAALTVLPVFVDEAIHISWLEPLSVERVAQLSLAGHSLFAVTAGELSVGKWLPVQIMRLFAFLPASSLVSARLASVSMGLATLIACVIIDSELFGAAAALLAGVLYAVLPFTLLYDRLALVDIYVTAFAAWAVVCAVRMTRRERAVDGVGLVLSTAAMILAKPTGAVFVPIPLLAAVLLVERGSRRTYALRTWPAIATGSAILPFLLWEGYGSTLVAEQSSMQPAWSSITDNMALLREWLMALLSPAVVWATLAGILWAAWRAVRGRRAAAFLVALLILSTAPYLPVARLWFPRYVLSAVVPVCLLVAATLAAFATALARLIERVAPGWRTAAHGVALVGLAIVVSLDCLRRDVPLALDPAAAELPAVERSQYVTGWASGYGLPELAQYLRQHADTGTINVVRFAQSGPPREGLDVYLRPSPSLHMRSVAVADATAAAQLRAATATARTFFVADSAQDEADLAALAAGAPTISRVWEYVRPGAETRLTLWELAAPRSPAGASGAADR